MKNNRLLWIAFAVVLAAVIWAGFHILSKRRVVKTAGGKFIRTIHLPATGPDQPCPGKTIALTMNDPYMRDVLKEGEKFNVIMNYYACNEIKRDDIVLGRCSSFKV